MTQQAVTLVLLPRMTAVGLFENFGLRRSLGNAVNLRQRAIFVVAALYREHRAFDCADLVFDRPGAESGIQPYIIPAPESRIRIDIFTASGLTSCRTQKDPLSWINPGNDRQYHGGLHLETC